MVDLVNNVVALRVNSRDRENISDPTTNFTIVLKKSLRNIAALNVAGVVIPRSDTLIGPNNDTITGAILVDASINTFSVSITRTNYTAATLATELQTKLNANTDMLSLGITFAVSYSSTTNRMTITATYPLGATHTWGIQIDFTSLRDVIGIGIAGTTPQTFMAASGATTLDITCTRAPQLIRALSYNITSAALTSSVNTSYLSSLGKMFNISGGNNLLRLESQLVTSKHSTVIEPPTDPVPLLTTFGKGLSMTSSGFTMAVGSNGYGAYIFSRSSLTSAWVEEAGNPIRDSTYIYGNQGSAVSISGDGTTLALSASERVYVYVRTGSTWTQQGLFLIPGLFQFYVSLNIDGSTLAVGSSQVSSYVAIYIRTVSVWSLQAVIPNPGGSVRFGSAGVSLSATGDNLVTGDTGFGSVVAYVYLRTGVLWALQQTIVPGTAVGGFIDGVAMAPGAGYLALCSSTDNAIGATWMYNWTGAVWNEQQKIVLTSSISVALNTAGDTVSIGARDAGAGSGFVHVWKRTGAVWAAQLTNYVGTGATGLATQGHIVAITGVGDDFVWAGPADNSGIGAIWSSHRTGVAWAQVLGKVTTSGGSSVIANFGSIISLAETGTTMAGGFPTYSTNAGIVFVYTVNGLEWAVEAKISPPSDAIGASQFGTSVDLSADGNTLAIGGQGDNAGVGATWIFVRSGTTWTKQTKIVNTLSPIVGQGRTVTIGSTGNTVVIGGSTVGGGLIIYTRLGTTWVRQENNLGAGLWGGFAISSIDISAAENVIVAGAAAGGAVVFSLIAGVWTQTGPNFISFHVPFAATVVFGNAVSISSSGSTIAVGDRDDNALEGATFIFTQATFGGAWIQAAILVGTPASAGPASRQGTSVALANSGTTLVVGGNAYSDGASTNTGAIWVFTFTSVWTQTDFFKNMGFQLGTAVSSQKVGGRFIAGAPGAGLFAGIVIEFAPAGTTYSVTTNITVPSRAYSIFDIVSALNELLNDSIAPGNEFTITFNGTTLTITAVIAAPVTENRFRVATASTFDVARWPSQDYKSSQVSNPIDFSINNDVIKSVVNHSDNSDNVIVDNTPDIIYRKYPAGYTINAGDPVDIQLRNDRDQIVDLNGADWIMTIYATVRS